VPAAEGQSLIVCSTEWVRPLGAPPTAVVIGDDDTVYAAATTAIVYALNTNAGGIRWRAVIGSPVTHPPALAHGMLYVGSADGKLTAVEADGCSFPLCNTSWSSEVGSEVTAQPAVGGDVVYVGSADGTLRAFDAGGCGDASICAPLWTANAGASVTGLAIYGGMLYVGTQAGLVAYRLPSG
jgi:outer membrane protein assembly factor BamB